MPFFTKANKERQGWRVVCLQKSMRVLEENAVVKNGKEAIFYGLSGVPPFGSIACATRSAPLQSRVGFVGGLQNRYAILHAAKLTYVYAFG